MKGLSSDMGFTLSNLLFLAVLLFLFYLLRGELRAILLLCASFLYLYTLDPGAIPPLLLCTILAWILGLVLSACHRRGFKRAELVCEIAGISVTVLSLLFFKLIPHFVLVHEGLLPRSDVLAGLILPIGYSYYSFQIISYFIDIRKERTVAEGNPIYFALYLVFFPKLVSGPIERPGSLMSQLRGLPQVRLWEPERFSKAMSCLVFGYFMKLMIADRVAPVVDTLFDSPVGFSAWTLILGSLLYTIQIYTDFAGYSLIAVGLGLLFGIRLSDNFNAPYLAVSISDFWRRWHISLSRWLTDYLYIPLGGNRRGTLRKCVNTMIVFLVCGIWHGSGLKFVAWGGLHGIYSVIGTLRRDKKQSLSNGDNKKRLILYNCCNRLITFFAVSFAWIPFGATSLSRAGLYIREMLTAWGPVSELSEELAYLSVEPLEIRLFLLSLAVVVLADVLIYWKKKSLPELAAAFPYPVRYALWTGLTLCFLVFGIYGPAFDASQFMYMQF